MPAIFISYRREDSIAYTGRLYDRLIAEFGKGQVFMDIDSIDPGADFIEAIEQTVAACDAVLVVIGRQWLTMADAQGRRRIENPEDFVRLEVETALSRKVRVVPVLVGGAQMPRSDELPAALGGLLRRHALDLPDTAFHQTLGRLVDSLRRDEAKAREPAKPERLARVEPAISKPVAPRTRVPSWAIAALVGAALAIGGAVVYFRTPSRPAATQTSLNSGGVTPTPVDSDEAASEKRVPKMDATVATAASGKRAPKVDTTAAAAASEKGAPGTNTTTATTPAITARMTGPDVRSNTREAVPVPAVAPRNPEPPAVRAGQTKMNPKDGLIYVWIPPGTFTMGCSPGDNECYDDEKPSHPVTITTGFWIGQTPVTQQAYQRVEEMDPSHFKGPQLPVETVNWNEAQSYCQAVGMRLPTSAEWEYAARAGTTGSRYGELDQVAWYFSNSGGKTHEVMQKQPNAWGLYDMLGNVWQWTATNSGANTKVVRGGSWYDDFTRYVRASYRRWFEPAGRDGNVGFRCVGELR